MGWSRARGSSRAIGLAERRLGEVARQWRCAPVPPIPAPDPMGPPEHTGGWGAITAGVDETAQGAHAGLWSRSAVRGLAVIIALAIAVAGYWGWSGRPRAVAAAPAVVALGTPLPMPNPTPVPTPSTAAAPDPSPGPEVPAAPITPALPVAPAASGVPQVVVHVTGLVARPGLVRLPLGARVADAVAEAGGVTRRRAADTVNLARILVDGEQVVVGVPGAPGSAGLTSPGSPAGTPPGNPLGGPAGTGPVTIDLNTAPAGELESLPGIGPVIAARIVAWRTANGAFRSVEELGEVSGIGDAILAQVRDRVRV